ncbi:MAG: PAS domain-containing protein, partial [Planctomycetes bacterium]|nr:PAS domain-containing protein [Planctomycetota bacterium]
ALDDELLAHAARLAAQVVTRREWERRRRGTERRLREAFRALPARAFVLDADGRLALANRAASAAWGLLPDDASGRDLRTLLVERPECDALLALADAARAGGTPVRRDALVLTDAPGCRRVLAACAVPLARGDTRGEVLCVLDDVTDARRAERARRTREAREHDALRLSGLGVLAGGLAHEVDGLVRSIHEGVGRIALGMNGDASLRDETAALERDAQRAADLVRLVLCCAGRAPSSAERLDLDALLRDMTHLLDAAAPSGARVELETSGGLPTVLGDAEQLRRLVLALVENAAEALPRGEGTVVVRTSARRLLRDDLAGLFLDRELREGSYVVLEVEDDGEGFDDALARRVFDPFFTTKATGRGLGLSAVLGIVRGHGGAVQLDSEPGRGTCVRVLLPAAGLAERVGERLGAG